MCLCLWECVWIIVRWVESTWTHGSRFYLTQNDDDNGGANVEDIESKGRLEEKLHLTLQTEIKTALNS